MKKITSIIILFSAIVLIGISCKKFVDINNNPNTPTANSQISEEFILPKAIVQWANLQAYATSYGEELTGYIANAGGVSGWGTLVSYNFGPGNWSGWWDLYDNIEDLNAVIKKSDADANYKLLGAAAKILKAVHFQALVDAYNNVPYTEANQGQANLTPKYDNGPDIYKSLAELLDVAINDINTGTQNQVALQLNNNSDPLFQGNLTLWKKFANTVKLRLIIRGGDKVSFTNKTFSADGFLTTDALVQPGYTTTAGKLNPTWARMYDVSGAAVAGGLQQRVPTYYILGFYSGNKLTDKYRGNLVYRLFPSPGVNQLGYDPGTAAAAKTNAPNDWYVTPGAITPSASNYASIGIFKGPKAPQPIMLASESYFLQAEAMVKGLLAGDADVSFRNGILESFKYLNKDENGNASNKYVDTTTGKIYASAPDTSRKYQQINSQKEFDDYIASNTSNYLVNFSAANTNEKKIEAIITQKYIAFNMLFGAEAWNEFRRTGYPVTTAPTAANRYTSFVSLQSASTAANKLPTRIQYPQAEFTYNAANVSQQKGSGTNGGINIYQDKIFWAK